LNLSKELADDVDKNIMTNKICPIIFIFKLNIFILIDGKKKQF
jgi:hypothetical protein